MHGTQTTATHLILVRHGQSLHNSDATLTDPDSGLTELGWRQARAVAEWLARRYQPDAILSSTLARAQQTGEVIAERFGLPLKLHVGLEEATQPYWDEMPFSQDTPLAAWDETWQPDPQITPRYAAFRARIHESLARLLTEYRGKTVIVVAHGGTIGTILRSLFGGHHVSIFTENSGVTHLAWEGRNWRLVYHNSTAHLEGQQPTAELPAPDPPPADAAPAEGRQFEAVARHYQEVAAALPGLPPALSDRDLREMLRLTAPRATDRVLDAAVGAGTVALAFAPHVASVLGVDLSAAMLEYAERNRSARGATNVRYRLGEISSLALPEESFEIIICHNLLCYASDPPALLGRFRSLLAPGGRLLVDETIGSDDPVKRATQNAIELRRDPAITEILSTGEIERAVNAAGLKISHSERYTVRLELDSWLAEAAADETTRAAVQSMIEAGLEADSAGLAARRTREGQLTLTQTRLRLLAVVPNETARERRSGLSETFQPPEMRL